MKDDLNQFIKTISDGSIKYEDPRKLKLSLIDKKIRKSIRNINLSKNVWTLWSCQGHKDNDGTTLPYITFIVKNKFIKKFLKLFYLTLPAYKSKIYPVTPSYYFTLCRGYSDMNFTIISIHWSTHFLSKNKHFNFYSELFYISKKLKDLK